MVYGIVAYSSFLMLIISTIKDTPATKSQSLIRSIYMIPGIITMILLAGSGPDITMETTDTIIVDLNSTTTWTEDTTRTFTLQNPVWVSLHYMLAIVMFAFIITRILQMLMFKD